VVMADYESVGSYFRVHLGQGDISKTQN